MLNRRGSEIVAYAFQHIFARAAVIAKNAHLDKLVGRETAFDLAQHGLRHAAVSDKDCGSQSMGAGFERTTLSGRELQRHVNLLKQAF
jgi:hypothetical protein